MPARPFRLRRVLSLRPPLRLLLLLPALALAAACGSGTSPEPGGETPAETSEPSAAGDELAVLDVEDFGKIYIELFPDEAPKTVENFKKLARDGFYDGTTFHRVIPGFMIQGGDPNTKNRDPRDDGRGGPGYTIPDEFSDVRHDRGIVSMANTGRPDSAGSQYFIVHQDSPHLDGKYTAFGRVVRGLDVVDAIAQTPRDQYGRHGPRDRPMEDVVVESVRIVPREQLDAESGDAS